MRTRGGGVGEDSLARHHLRLENHHRVALQGRLRHRLGRRRLNDLESLAKAHAARVEALRACRAAPKPKPMASTPLEAEALALLEKQREGLSWSVSETDASGRPMPI